METYARAEHPDATMVDLYAPGLMPPDLRKAHQVLDRAVDRLYRRTGFASERERVEHLFMLYEKMSAPLKAAMQAKPKRRQVRASRSRHAMMVSVNLTQKPNTLLFLEEPTITHING